ncbi:MAG: hypothetical protein A2571_02950 [Candidatus Vogelbacteria bacterium RIFOXYD1_FULL_44_32]|uniref:Uncharacterized protein n=1 Tax=Candidatus Vogelbacteria bacterium RIFOXYD1_FULL_44_32 TaxID=1802438 RepID=A0A1G2QC93_9BACT|nr:MAG: hypothetical protein A2571_02950 [Candidatus Vogelbacteria bacterium RIFOXYD1_FULL_44_32]
MPIQNQSSFIPRENVGLRPRRESTMGIMMMIALIIVGLSLFLFAGAYSYRYVLDLQVNKPCAGDGTACGLKATVENTRRNLGIDSINRYNRLDKKMKVAESLINSHTNMVPLFDLLERLTLHTVRFTKLDLDGDKVFLEGVAVGYTDLAAQLKVLEASNSLRGAVFSNLGLDQSGNVTFSLELVPVPSLLAYLAN